MNAWDFTLELISRLTPIVLALIVWLQMKAKAERVEIKETLKGVAKSVDGMKSELVAATAKGSFLEGAASVGSPEAAAETVTKAAEVAREVLALAADKAKGP